MASLLRRPQVLARFYRLRLPTQLHRILWARGQHSVIVGMLSSAVNIALIVPNIDVCLPPYPADAAPDVYTVAPPQPTEKKPGQLEQWQVGGAR